MNWRDLRSRIEHLHKSDPSKQLLLDNALRQIEEGLAVLSREGHFFHLSPGHRPHKEWPKTLYHFRLGPKLVKSEWEQKELGEGWYDSPRDAELKEGLDIQFAGRGGVRRSQLPSYPLTDVKDLMPNWKEEEKEKFLLRRRNELESVIEPELNGGKGGT